MGCKGKNSLRQMQVRKWMEKEAGNGKVLETETNKAFLRRAGPQGSQDLRGSDGMAFLLKISCRMSWWTLRIEPQEGDGPVAYLQPQASLQCQRPASHRASPQLDLVACCEGRIVTSTLQTGKGVAGVSDVFPAVPRVVCSSQNDACFLLAPHTCGRLQHGPEARVMATSEILHILFALPFKKNGCKMAPIYCVVVIQPKSLHQQQSCTDSFSFPWPTVRQVGGLFATRVVTGGGDFSVVLAAWFCKHGSWNSQVNTLCVTFPLCPKLPGSKELLFR